MDSTHSSSKLEFNIELYKSLMEEAPSIENGWGFEYEGIVPNFPGISSQIFHF